MTYIPVPYSQPCSDPLACKMKIEGKGSAKAKPDRAMVVLGVVTENKQLKPAQEENTLRMTAVLRSLNENGVSSEDIQTQAYNIVPQYDYVEGSQVFRGYRVEHSLEINIKDMVKIGQIIDDAVQSGANQVGSVRFSVSNPTAYYQMALAAAVDDACVKARTFESKFNITVSGIPVRIVEMGRETGGPTPMVMYQSVGSATPIQTGMIEISAQIEAVFSYKPRYY